MQLMTYTSNQWQQQGLQRHRRIATKDQLSFNSSDYLGLSQHPKLITAAQKELSHSGLSSNGSALVNGFKQIHLDFECAFAEFMGFERALFFSSGYMANLAIVQSLFSHHDTLFYDQHCHASLIDSMLLSSAKRIRYRHCNTQQLALRLSNANDPSAIISNTVFSTSGAIAPLKELSQLKNQFNCKLIIDDAHGLGVFGKEGRGTLSHLGLDHTDTDLVSYPLSKGFGCFGAMLCGNNKLIEQVIQYSRSYRYSTLIPPLFARAGISAVKLLRIENWRQQKLSELITYFKQKTRSLNFIDSDSAIQSLEVVSSHQALKIQQQLSHDGIAIGCLRPPSVPKYKNLLRITLTANHTTTHIDTLIHELQKYL